MAGPEGSDARRDLPSWGPLELAQAVSGRPLAVMEGLTWAGRPCALVAWGEAPAAAPQASVATLEEAFARAASCPLPPGAPALLGAVVGAIAWDGTSHFWLPAAAALFDPTAGALWVRGELPATLGGGLPAAAPPPEIPPRPAQRRWDWDGYAAAVRAAQERMAAGDLEKLILSVPFEVPCDLPPLTIYQRLTAGHPPGLRFLLETGGWVLTGVSPEPLVTLTGRRAELHLLAGTRPDPGPQQNATQPDPAAIAQELQANPKDQVEHAVAVEQSRRDLLAVCEPASVAVERYMGIERHPGLIHLASHLAGQLRPDATPSQLIRACFPAGTVGGVPRKPAGAIIEALEPQPRGWYAGAVGALLPGGDVQLWLTIRSVFAEGGVAIVRTGAGLVAASDPAAEWRECHAKARRALAALGAYPPEEVTPHSAPD